MIQYFLFSPIKKSGASKIKQRRKPKVTTILRKKDIRKVADEKPGPFKTMVVIIPQPDGETITERITDGVIRATKFGSLVFNSLNHLVCGKNACVFFANYV